MNAAPPHRATDSRTRVAAGCLVLLTAALAPARASSYSDLVLHDKPAAYYRLSETNGATAADAITPATNGTCGGGVTLGIAGPQAPYFTGFETDNTGARFDGAAGCLTTTPALDDSRYSFEVWFKFVTQGDLRYLGGRGTAAGMDAVGFAGNQLLLVAGPVVAYSGFAVADDIWHHLVFTRADTAVTVYLDNVVRISTNAPSNYGSSKRIVLGIRPDGVSPFNGSCDELALYGTALTAAQVDRHFSAAHAEPSPPTGGTATIPITYKLPRAGKVSLGIYNAQGRQMRTLRAGEPQTAGHHRLEWDGLDRVGQAVPLGSYSWRLLLHDGLEADYVSLLGETPPAPFGTSWIGNQMGPQFVEVANNGELYVGTTLPEGPPQLLKMTSDNGPVQWRLGWQSIGPTDVALITNSCILLSFDAYLYRYDAATGQPLGQRIDVAWPGDVRTNFWQVFGRWDSMKIAADGTSVVVAYRDHDALHWINPATGELRQSVTVPHPLAVAPGADGVLYVLNSSSVLAVAPGGNVTMVISNGVLAAPGALAYDPANNQLLVAEGGPDQRIHRFTTHGVETCTYGRQGGRLDGAYVKTDFSGVTDLACDYAGGFYAVEPNGVRRIVHVRADGSIAKEWLGGVPFFAAASADPAEPEEVWYNASESTMARLHLELITGAWTLQETYTMPTPTFGDGLFPSLAGFPHWRVRHLGNDTNTFLIHEFPPAVLRVDRAGRRLVPVALAGYKSDGGFTSKSAILLAAMASQGLTYADEASDGFTWADANGNGVIETNEFRFSAHPVFLTGHTTFDTNMNLYVGYADNDWQYFNKRYRRFDFVNSAYVKVPNIGRGPAAPAWDWNKLEYSTAKVPAELRQPGSAYATIGIRVSPRGGMTLALRGGGLDRHGAYWPDFENSSAHLLQVLPDGTNVAVLAKHRATGTPEITPGGTTLGEPVYLPGMTHGCVVCCDRAYYGATVWTDDGLYAGFFLDRHVTDDVPDWAYRPGGNVLDAVLPADDWSSGGSITDLADGSVLWFPPAGGGRFAVYRIHGWDNWYRATGTVAVAKAPTTALPSGWGLTGRYYRGTSFAGDPVYTRIDPQLWFSSSSSDQSSWAYGPCPGIASNEVFSVRWTGWLVAPLTEKFVFRAYNTYNAWNAGQIWTDGAGYVRVWVDGVLVLDRSAGAPPGGSYDSDPLRLEAGRSYAIDVEYVHPAGMSAPEFSLCWSSYVQEWQRIPTVFLHPSTATTRPVVHVVTLNPTARESGGKPGFVEFHLDSPLRTDLEVRYHVGGTADRGAYSQLSGVAVIRAGTTSTQVLIRPGNAAAVEGNRTVRLVLDPSAAYQGDTTTGAATVTIVDDNNRVTNGLVHYYPLNETGGAVLTDAAGSSDGAFRASYSGYPVPQPRWLPTGGKLGGALEFNEISLMGLAAAVDLPDPHLTDTDFTVSFWVRTTQANSCLLQTSFDLCMTNGQPRVIYQGCNLAPAGPRIDDGLWHHLAFTWSQTNHVQELFVDGASVSSGRGPASGRLGALTFSQPMAQPQGGPFLGRIDDIRVYNRCLGTDELATLARFYPTSKKYPIPTVSGPGTPQAALAAGTSRYDCGSATMGGSPADCTFTIHNTGSAPLHLTESPRVTVDAAGQGDFTIIRQPAATIAAGRNTTFTVRFSPIFAGPRVATISFEHDGPVSQSPYTIAVAGTGVDRRSASAAVGGEFGAGPAEKPEIGGYR